MQRTEDELILTSVAGTEARFRIAGAGARSHAFLIDWSIRALWSVLLLALLFGLALVVPVLRGSRLPWLLPAAVYLLYHPVLEWLQGGITPGKRRAGVRIVTAEGDQPGFWPILVRNLLRIVDSLPALYAVGLTLCVVDGRARRLGDMAAGTVLVMDDAADDALETLAARRGSGLDPALAEVAADLLARWDTLAPERRTALAERLLTRVDAGTGGAPGADLRVRIEQLLGARP